MSMYSSIKNFPSAAKAGNAGLIFVLLIASSPLWLAPWADELEELVKPPSPIVEQLAQAETRTTEQCYYTMEMVLREHRVYQQVMVCKDMRFPQPKFWSQYDGQDNVFATLEEAVENVSIY